MLTFENIHEGWLVTCLANRTLKNLLLAAGAAYSIFIVSTTCLACTSAVRVNAFSCFFASKATGAKIFFLE
jgi:hypothetical protein